VFENRVVRKIFAPKRDEVTGEWRRLLKEELHDLCFSPDVIWVMKLGRIRWAGHGTRVWKRRGVYRVLVGRPEGKRPLGRLGCRWEDNMKVDVQEVRWVVGGGGAWARLIWFRTGAGGGLL
jgi:hypothetical protein